MNVYEQIFSLFVTVYATISIIIVILERKRPEKTIAWLLVIALLPLVGLVLYLLLGRNWKIHRLNYRFSPYVKALSNTIAKKIEIPAYAPLIELLANNSDSPLYTDNEIRIFKNGREKFKYLKEAMLNAQHHIHLEYFIIKNDHIGNEIKEILIHKAKQGVKVRVIYDKVGSIKLKRSFINELKAAGVEMVPYTYFLAPLLRYINTYINYRNHRKIAVIDGRIGFIGGINIGDDYLGKGKLGYWRDTHLMVKGDFVQGLQSVFLDDYWAVKRMDNGDFPPSGEFRSCSPKPEPAKGKVMQLLKGSPDSAFPAIMHGMLKMITMAQKNIYITTPYFVPSESIMEALKVAALGGVDVRILFPGKYDHYLVHKASKTYLAELAKCGVKIYYYDSAAFIHAKVMTIDGKIATVGTANMDIRSFDLNYEINAVIYDAATTKKLEQQFAEDLKVSARITQEEFENTPRLSKAIEAVARIFSSLL